MCECCIYCVEEYRIDKWLYAYHKSVCRKDGHKFKDKQIFPEYNFIAQECSECKELKLIHLNDRTPCTEEENVDGFSLLMVYYLNQDVLNAYKALPTMPWKEE